MVYANKLATYINKHIFKCSHTHIYIYEHTYSLNMFIIHIYKNIHKPTHKYTGHTHKQGYMSMHTTLHILSAHNI